MSTQERLQKLEALLGRVKARAAEPRAHAAPPAVPSASGLAPAPAASPRAPETRPAFSETTPAVPTPAIAFTLPASVAARRPSAASSMEETAPVYGSPRELDAPFAEDETRKEPFVRPAAKASTTAPPPTANYSPAEVLAAEAEAIPGVEVEMSSDLVEVDIDVDETGLDDEELAAAEADDAARVALATAGSLSPPAELEVVDDDDEVDTPRPRPANEIEEPAPSSSPRPILEAAEPEPSPLHTPPPESGKQVAASAPPRAPSGLPSLNERSLSEPPDSLGGHTLIGGWREPGLGPGGPAGMGVRVPAPIGNMPSPVSVPPPTVTAPHGAPPQQAASAQPFVGASPGVASGGFSGPKPARTPNLAPPAPPPPAPSLATLAAAVTSPQLSQVADARVATYAGVPPAFSPASFGELLDATLAL